MRIYSLESVPNQGYSIDMVSNDKLGGGKESRRMGKRGGKHVSSEEFRDLFRRGKPVRISRLVEKLGVSRSTVTRQMRRHGTLTSINDNAAFCVLPRACRFDALGFCRFGRTVFFRDGNQLDAIVRLVSESASGMELPQINAAIGSRTAMQALNLVRDGRLQRRKLGELYVYLAADARRAERQLAERDEARRKSAPLGPEESLAQFLAEESRENVELLLKVLMTCLRHPQFSAKSVALSLVRRGSQTSTEQVRKLFERFELGGKRGS